MTRRILLAAIALLPLLAAAQDAESRIPEPSDTTFLTLDQALEIALSENVAVKVADKEIERSGYAKKGTYAALFPQINASGSFQRTIKKQIMYMDQDDSGEGGGGGFFGSIAPYFMRIQELSALQGLDPVTVAPSTGSSSEGFAVGRWNAWSTGISANMPLVNAQLWKSIEISGQQVELAVEQARSSRLDMVTQVKQAFYAVLLAKEALSVYRSVYDNSLQNLAQTEKRYNAQKASELEYTRAKATAANTIPNVFNAESSVILALWQLKAVMGVDLELPIDVAGTLSEYSEGMGYDIALEDSASLDRNSTLRQLAIQAEQLAATVKMQQYASLPSLSLGFAYNYSAMANDFVFKNYKWTPYSYVGLSLSIPIFSGGQRLNQIRQTRVQAAELDLQRMDTERKLRIAIRQYLTTMQTNIKSYAAARDAERTARKAYDIAAKSYAVGRSTITDLNDAQLGLTQSQLAVSQAVYNFVVAKSQLEQTLGYDFLDDRGNVDLVNR